MLICIKQKFSRKGRASDKFAIEQTKKVKIYTKNISNLVCMQRILRFQYNKFSKSCLDLRPPDLDLDLRPPDLDLDLRPPERDRLRPERERDLDRDRRRDLERLN